MGSTIGPTIKSERIQSLDVLRGFSLLGIFLVNMISFHSPYSYYNPYEWWKYGDLTVYTWLDVFVQASFYPIFAMMFGYGMVIMQQRSAIKGHSFWKISVRRLTVLLGFGIVHAFFIWYGDILITYAIMGLVLLLFLRIRGSLLIITGAVIYILPQLFIGGLLILAFIFEQTSLTDFTNIVGLQQSEQIYSTGTFLEITKQRFVDWNLNNKSGGFLIYFFIILPLMLIGAGAAKLKWLQKASHHIKKWILVLIISLPLGIAVKMLPLYLEPSFSIQYAQDMIGGPILGIAFISLIVLLMNSRLIRKLFQPLASAGRMSISIYLSQSIIGTLIFYNYGLGLYGKISMATGTWLAIGIFAIQVILAEIWLSFFKQGPVEKLWRMMTYGKSEA